VTERTTGKPTGAASEEAARGATPRPAPQKQKLLEDLVGDLVAEHQVLDEMVAGVHETSWDLPTPAEGWAVRDQVSHLAFFDEAATLALIDPEAFSERAQSVLSGGSDPMDEHLRRGRAMAPEDLLEWWRKARRGLTEAAPSSPPGTRVPWYGPPMALESLISARVMETWAHGQDVADALGVLRVPTDRLRHVAHIGVRARPFSYAVRGLELPSGSVRVELDAPSGERWEWEARGVDARATAGATGDPVDDASGKTQDGATGEIGTVRGTALDFCLVVTQRRHVDDTGLEVDGALASGWMRIAQAFAGPPGRGRAAGSARDARG